jgi:hypothetical protein
MHRTAPEFRVSNVDLDATSMSPDALLSRLSDLQEWPEASVHPPVADFPRLDLEYHPGVGYSILCFEDERSIGYLAAQKENTTSPAVAVNLGGQMIEKWPPELFLAEAEAAEVLRHFWATGHQHPSFAWIRLDGFEREVLHEGGASLYEFWKQLSSEQPR